MDEPNAAPDTADTDFDGCSRECCKAGEHTRVSVSDVSNFKPGKSQGSAHVIARFKSTKDDDSETHD